MWEAPNVDVLMNFTICLFIVRILSLCTLLPIYSVLSASIFLHVPCPGPTSIHFKWFDYANINGTRLQYVVRMEIEIDGQLHLNHAKIVTGDSIRNQYSFSFTNWVSTSLIAITVLSGTRWARTLCVFPQDSELHARPSGLGPYSGNEFLVRVIHCDKPSKLASKYT